MLGGVLDCLTPKGVSYSCETKTKVADSVGRIGYFCFWRWRKAS